MPGPLSCLFLLILRSYSRGLLVTCKVGHLPWEHREGDRAVLPSAQPLMATQHVLSTASIPPRRKSKCCTHHGLSFISLSAPSPSTWPLLTHNSHNGPPSGPETDPLFPLPGTPELPLTLKVAFLARPYLILRLN